MTTTPPTSEELLAQLRTFGPPLFVPAGRWRVAGVDHSGGVSDGVVVFGDAGETVRTTALTRGLTPISIRVFNLQAATANSPDPETRHRVIVEEDERDVTIAGATLPARVLRSHSFFSFELVVEDRIVSAGAALHCLDTWRIERRDELSLTGG